MLTVKTADRLLVKPREVEVGSVSLAKLARRAMRRPSNLEGFFGLPHPDSLESSNSDIVRVIHFLKPPLLEDPATCDEAFVIGERLVSPR